MTQFAIICAHNNKSATQTTHEACHFVICTAYSYIPNATVRLFNILYTTKYFIN